MNIKTRYFHYICDLMLCDLPEHRNYEHLMSDMYDKEFTYVLDMDENRVYDALDLRREFLFDCGYDVTRDYWEEGVSVLEVLAALSKRIEIEVTGEPGDDHIERWFWEMLSNLDVLYPDDRYEHGIVEYKLDTWMLKRYDRDGTGSVFPLKNWRYDQREIDVWYQGQLYLSENWHF